MLYFITTNKPNTTKKNCFDPKKTYYGFWMVFDIHKCYGSQIRKVLFVYDIYIVVMIKKSNKICFLTERALLWFSDDISNHCQFLFLYFYFEIFHGGARLFTAVRFICIHCNWVRTKCMSNAVDISNESIQLWFFGRCTSEQKKVRFWYELNITYDRYLEEMGNVNVNNILFGCFCCRN